MEMLGKYEVKGQLGRGAMGTVYDGWDPLIARRVAIKTIELPNPSDQECREEFDRFRREAQVAGRLTHPNIVGVFDYGETNNKNYIVMEYVDGLSLKTLLDKTEGVPLTDTLHIMSDVLAGLQFSHERGVVHRDVSPANVVLTSSGQAKIVDFGIARIEGSWMTQAGTVLGTPSYMSPEQFMGQVADARSDIYSAGVLFYQLLTGDRPFEGAMSAIMYKVLNTDPTAPSRLSVMVPPAFDAVVRQAMARRPEDRYPTAAAFAEAIEVASRQTRLIRQGSAAMQAASSQAFPSIRTSEAAAPEGSVAALPDRRRSLRAKIAAAAAGRPKIAAAAAGRPKIAAAAAGRPKIAAAAAGRAKITAAGAAFMILAGGGIWWQWQTPGTGMPSTPAPAASQPQAVALNPPPPSLQDASQTPQTVAASNEGASSPVPPAVSQLTPTAASELPDQSGVLSTVSPALRDAPQTPQPDAQAQKQDGQPRATDGIALPQPGSLGTGQADTTAQEANAPNAGPEAAAPQAVAGPVRLRATLLVPARSVALERRVPVQESLTDHGLLPTTHAYTRIVYRLGTGESYGGASFQASSSDNASTVAMDYQPVPRAVTMSFSLRSGPFIHPWLASLSGVALVRVRRDEPKQVIELPDISLSLPGQTEVRVTEPLVHRPQLAVRLRNPASGAVAEVPVGSTGMLDGHVVSVHFEGMTLMVIANPM